MKNLRGRCFKCKKFGLLFNEADKKVNTESNYCVECLEEYLFDPERTSDMIYRRILTNYEDANFY